MPNRIVILLAVLALSCATAAQEMDFSHSLYQQEMQNWDYGTLMDCGIKYEITVDIYQSLSTDPAHFAEAIARWDHAHQLFDNLGRSAAAAQGMTDETIGGLRDFKMEVLMEPVVAAGDNKNALADVAMRYMQEAKGTCAPYFETLKPRLESIEKQIS